MDKNHCNTAIHCTVEQCANHCCSAEYCSLDSIHVGTHEASPSVDQCTDCMSCKRKYAEKGRSVCRKMRTLRPFIISLRHRVQHRRPPLPCRLTG